MTQTEWQTVFEALRNAELQIEHLHDMFQETATGNRAIARLRAAIKIMEAN